MPAKELRDIPLENDPLEISGVLEPKEREKTRNR